jgi:hypothetical protein
MDIPKNHLADRLETIDLSLNHVLVGFDGFIDEIVHPVDKRLSIDQFTRIDTITAFAKRIDRASGLSTNIELVPIQKKIGGNGPIMTNALAQHHPKITYIGTLGFPHIDPIFKEMGTQADLITIADCGHTDAYEFLDGKLLFGKMDGMNDVTYSRLIDRIGKKRLIQLLDQADLFVSVNWSMLPYMSGLWENFQEKILPHLTKRSQRPIMFVDLADPEKRDPDAIRQALGLLRGFQSHFFVVLGLNKKEAYDIGRVLHLFDEARLMTMAVSLKDITCALNQALALDGIVVHPVDSSATVISGTYQEAKGPFCANPKLTTGAGDNFNAGFVLGLLLGLDPLNALQIGMATSGYYVRHAASPTTMELVQFIRDWANEKL